MSDFDALPTSRRAAQQPDLEGVGTNTQPMWAISLLPLGGVLIGLIPAPFNGYDPDPTATGLVLNAVALLLSLALVVVGVLLAVADRRILRQRGIIRPMHPAWEILDPVYVIGRTVVVHRRVRGSLAPLWLWIGAWLFAAVVNNLPR